MTRGDNASIGDGTTLEFPFAPDVIQEDINNDGWETCDDPILLVKVRCPLGWELEEDEDSISFNNSSDFYTYIIRSSIKFIYKLSDLSCWMSPNSVWNLCISYSLTICKSIWISYDGFNG